MSLVSSRLALVLLAPSPSPSPSTLALALFSFVLTWVLAIPAGIHSATHPRSIGDHLLTVINYVGVAIPNFMLALVLMWIAFAYFDISITGLFSVAYVQAPWSFAKFVDLLGHIWLPALVIGILTFVGIRWQLSKAASWSAAQSARSEEFGHPAPKQADLRKP